MGVFHASFRQKESGIICDPANKCLWIIFSARLLKLPSLTFCQPLDGKVEQLHTERPLHEIPFEPRWLTVPTPECRCAPRPMRFLTYAGDAVFACDVNSSGEVHFNVPVVELQWSQKISTTWHSRRRTLGVYQPRAVWILHLVYVPDICCIIFRVIRQ